MKALGPFEVSAVSEGRTGLGLGIIIGACEVVSVSDEVMSSSVGKQRNYNLASKTVVLAKFLPRNHYYRIEWPADRPSFGQPTLVGQIDHQTYVPLVFEVVVCFDLSRFNYLTYLTSADVIYHLSSLVGFVICVRSYSYFTKLEWTCLLSEIGAVETFTIWCVYILLHMHPEQTPGQNGVDSKYQSMAVILIRDLLVQDGT